MVCTAAACPAPHPRWRKAFLAMLPAIVKHAKYSFRHLRGEARQDCIQETIADALVAFVALARRGKMKLAYPTVLARYAVAQINDDVRRIFRLSAFPCATVFSRSTIENECAFDRRENGLFRPESLKEKRMVVLSIFEQVAREADSLPSDEQLRLIARLAERLAAAGPAPRAENRPRWEDFAGRFSAPMCGEDAQLWVTRTRSESDPVPL